MRVLLLALLIAVAPARAVATQTPETAETPVFRLSPDQMSGVAALLARLQPALRLRGVGIEYDHVVAHLCADAASGGACFVLRLDHSRADCGDMQWGQFCASFPDGPPAPATASTIAATLRNAGDVVAWNTGGGARAPIPRPPVFEILRPWLAPLALILVPLVGGWCLGAAWRRWRGVRQRSRLPAVVSASALIVAVIGLDTRLALIGIWDALMIAGLLAAGWFAGVHRGVLNARRVAAASASLLLSLSLVELASRRLLPPPPAFPSDAGPSLLLADAMRSAQHTGFAWTEAGTVTAAPGGGSSRRRLWRTDPSDERARDSRAHH